MFGLKVRSHVRRVVLSTSLAAMTVVPALAAPVTVLGATGMQYDTPLVMCDAFIHRLTITARAGAANLNATTPQVIYVRLWIFNNTTQRYPFKWFSDGSTNWGTMYHTPTSTINTATVSFTEFTAIKSQDYLYTVPAGNYSVWAQYAWPNGSSFIYSPVVQATSFRYAFNQFGINAYGYATSCNS